MHKLALLLRVQGGQDFFLHPGHIPLNMGQSLHTLWRDPQQLAPAVSRIGFAQHPFFGFQPPNDRTRGGRVKRHPLGQADLINARAVQQGIQNGKLHRRDVGTGQLLGKNGNGNLLSAPYQVSRRGLQVNTLNHVCAVLRMIHGCAQGAHFQTYRLTSEFHFSRKRSMSFVFSPTPVVSVPVLGQDERFPVHRIYCVGRNYEEHAKEMGFTGREPPFFFLKPADSLVVVESGKTGVMPYPTLTQNLHHEIELVVAIGKGGRNIQAADAAQHIYGYAVGLDMTRRDLQNEMKKQGRPWCIGKAFDHSAPMGPITPIAHAGDVNNAEISLQVNGADRQHSNVAKLIWNVAETIEHLSAAWELQPGDLIYTGTPEGVAAVVAGDVLVGQVAGLESLEIAIS